MRKLKLCFWGANSHGQSGMEDPTVEQYDNPVDLNLDETFVSQIESISGGGGHTLILVKNGKCYASGWNNKGQLGLGSFEDSYRFQELQCDQHFNQVACGWDLSAGITSDGELYCWGNNQYHQFGTSSPIVSNTPVLVKLPNNSQVKTITFGLRHTAILTFDNQIYLFGKSRCTVQARKLSLEGFKLQTFLFNEVEYLQITAASIKNIAAGQYYVLAQIDSSRLLIIGENKHAELCNEIIEMQGSFGKIESGWTHSGVLLDTGHIYSFGRNNYHQLGIGKELAFSRKPVKLLFDQELIRDFKYGSEHGVALTTSGRIYTWGWNEHGNCGTNGVEDVKIPSELSTGPCLAIFTGCGFNFALIEA